MADVSIPLEAVEAAAAELRDLTGGTWENQSGVRGVLEAAAPLIVAAELDRIASLAMEAAESLDAADLQAHKDDWLSFARTLQGRAAQLRAAA